MPAAILGPIAGSVVGGLMSDGGGESQTASKEPWEPARKPLINSINTGQDLERYYQQNPFNPLQQQGYQNLFADLDQFRGQMAPQLMQFANGMMNSNYQRGPRNSQMEMMPRQPQGLMGQMAQNKPMQMQQGGLMGLLGQNFGAPQAGAYGGGGAGGLLNFSQLNPFTSTVNGIPAKPAAPPEPPMTDANRALLERILAERQFAEDSGRFA